MTLPSGEMAGEAVLAGRLVRVSDPGDPRMLDYRGLTDTALRLRREEPEGLFVAESEIVIRRALGAGYRMRSLLLEERWLPRMSDVVVRAILDDVPVYVADRAVLAGVTGFDVHRGALAAMQRVPLPPLSAVLAGARLAVVLEDMVNPTNVGAVFRSAAGLGVDAVLLSPRCADPLYRRSVRVSMGTVLVTPYARIDDWRRAPETLADEGFEVVALTPAPDAVDLDAFAARRPRKVAVLLGTEGAGLSPQWLSTATVRVRIPMREGVDSLNVGAAAAVAFHVLRRPGATATTSAAGGGPS